MLIKEFLFDVRGRMSSVVAIGIVCELLFQRCALNLNVVIVSAFCFFYPTYNEVLNANDRRNSVVYKNSFCLKMLVVTFTRAVRTFSFSSQMTRARFSVFVYQLRLKIQYIFTWKERRSGTGKRNDQRILSSAL